METSGSAERWGPRWGARPRDWSKNEEQQVPTYDEAIRRVGVASGQRVLDVGCGTGVFRRAAADRGAQVFGLDASEALLEVARRRVPKAELRRGDMQFLPYEDYAFDVVTGFNSFFFAADMVATSQPCNVPWPRTGPHPIRTRRRARGSGRPACWSGSPARAASRRRAPSTSHGHTNTKTTAR